MKYNASVPVGLAVGDEFKCGDGFTWECVFYVTSGKIRMECKDIIASESLEEFFERKDITEIVEPPKRYYDHYQGHFLSSMFVT